MDGFYVYFLPFVYLYTYQVRVPVLNSTLAVLMHRSRFAGVLRLFHSRLSYGLPGDYFRSLGCHGAIEINLQIPCFSTTF